MSVAFLAEAIMRRAWFVRAALLVVATPFSVVAGCIRNLGYTFGYLAT